MDAARKWTDEQLHELEARFEDAYKQAADEMQAKLEAALKDYARENEQRQKALDDTPEARKAYEAWKKEQVADQTWMRDMVETLSKSAHDANKHAAAMINDEIPRMFAENANMTAYAVEKKLGYDAGFTLVNEDAVRVLMGLPYQQTGYDQLIREVTKTPDPARAHVQDLRKREVQYPADMRWNRQKFASAITQGILQGESIPDIVKRVNSIYGMNKNSARLAARTATTNAENAGRMSSFERAQALGIDMEIEWLATPDGRTRSTHRELDGQRVHTGEKFANGLRWPGDPLGDPSEVWNCRCRANGRVVGFDGKRGDWADERGERWTRLPKGMTYDEWKKAKEVSRDESYKNESETRTGFWPSTNQTESETQEVFAVDSMHPETVGGVRRTADSMTFDEANELRGNPKFNMVEEAGARYEEANRKVNEYARAHGYDDSEELARLRDERSKAMREYHDARREVVKYTINCQTCVVANEARRRGYDVHATGNVEGSDNDRLSRDTTLAWIDPVTGQHPNLVKYDGRGRSDVRGDPIPTKAAYWRWLNEEGRINEGERYTIEFSWGGRTRAAHIINMERTSDGIRLYDPQCGTSYVGDAAKKYLERAKYVKTSYGRKYAWGPEILRIDNLEFDSSMVNSILTGGDD